MTVFLRKLNISDTGAIVSLADNPRIAGDMSTLPSPFTRQHAMKLVSDAESGLTDSRGIVSESEHQLTGVITLRDFEPSHRQAELSVWIGEPFWSKGYGTAAIRLMTESGFREHDLNRIYAFCMVRNRGSQHILEKPGFTREGLLRERVIINGIYEDVYIYAKLSRDR